ncbi:hypothetical protein [Novosphingobium sp. AAP83]|uniref:hypothetical protein n=1 Tax=Novosphingobium sp. AAP83 TaxID=1523425 RepID=UPI0006B92C52|nr:hypothetical protein [Novosphingobium sp. AAP83]
MIASANRVRSAGWLVLLGLCVAMVLVLAFRVNALRSQIHRAEARIIALKQDKMYLETEFETRANQQQLKVWNDVEFGYAAPDASQYLEGERELASLSVPDMANTPEPIRVASMDDRVIASAAFPAMVSPLSGKALTSANDTDDSEAQVRRARMDHAEAVVTLKDRLGTVVEVAPRKPVRTETVSEKERAVAPAKKPEKKVAKAEVSGKVETAKSDKANKAGKANNPKGDKTKSKQAAKETADKPAAKKAKARAEIRAAGRKEAKATG